MDTRYSDDRRLLKECLSHVEGAWDRFVDRYARLVYAAIVQTLGKHGFPTQHHTVEDLYQSVFLSLIERGCRDLRQFRWECKLGSWLHVVAVRQTIDFLRRQKPNPVSLNGDTDLEESIRAQLSDSNPSPDQHVAEKEEKLLLAKARSQLKPREQLFVELYYVKELPAASVAQLLGITANNVYQMKSRIRSKIRRILEKVM